MNQYAEISELCQPWQTFNILLFVIWLVVDMKHRFLCLDIFIKQHILIAIIESISVNTFSFFLLIQTALE